MKTKFKLVEDVLNIYDNRYWYYIEGFNGYELSNDGYIRSMKHYKKYPYGILVQPKKDKNKNIIHLEDPIYELSNNQNERVCLKLSQIIDIVNKCEYHMSGYPRRTCMIDISSRNQRCTIKKKYQYQQADKIHFRSPKFTIIKDQEEKIQPIEFI